MQLTIRGTQHVVLGYGQNRRTARIDASVRMLQHLGVPQHSQPMDKPATDAAGPSSGPAGSVSHAHGQGHHQRGSGRHGKLGSHGDRDSDSDTGGGRHRHRQRQGSRSPATSDVEEATDDAYEVLANTGFLARSKRGGAQGGKHRLAEDGGTAGGSKGYVQDIMQQIADELDDWGPPPPAGGAGPGSKVGAAGKPPAGPKAKPVAGVKSGAGKQKAAEAEDSEEEEGELPSE